MPIFDPTTSAATTVTVGSLQIQPGATVTVPITIDTGTANVTSVDIGLNYGDGLVTFSSATIGNVMTTPGSWTLNASTEDVDVDGTDDLATIQLRGFSDNPIAANSTSPNDVLVNVLFTVDAGTTAGSYDVLNARQLVFDTTETRLLGMSVSTLTGTTETAGQFDIPGIVYGDVTGEGDISAYDASHILEEVVNTGHEHPIETAAPLGWDDATLTDNFGFALSVIPTSPLTAVNANVVTDVDGSGTSGSPDVGSNDALEVLAYAVGLPTGWTPESGPSGAGPAALPLVNATGLLRGDGSDVRPGGRITVTLHLSDASHRFSGELFLAYDEDLLDVTAVRFLGSGAHPLIAYHAEEGEVRVALASVTPIASDNARLDIVFRVSPDLTRPVTGSIRASHLALNGQLIRTRFAHVFVAQPYQTRLLPNYPNPFNPETWIPFELAEAGRVTITIHDGNARRVRTLDIGDLPAGAYDAKEVAAYWDGRNDLGELVSSGVYFYELNTASYRAVRRMVILK